MKKLLSVTLVIAMTLCLLVGCGGEPAQQTEPKVNNPTPVGMFVLNAGAATSISYDADGLVLRVEGADDNGILIVNDEADFVGMSCADVAKELIQLASTGGQLNAEVKNIVIKQVTGSKLPGSHFLETIEDAVTSAAQAAGSTAVITLIDETKLDENGYINFETAKALLLNELGVEEVDQYYGPTTLIDDCYICTVEVAGVQTAHTIDAITGSVADATNEELLGNEGEAGETEEPILDDELYEEEGSQDLPDDELPAEQETPEDTADAADEQ